LARFTPAGGKVERVKFLLALMVALATAIVTSFGFSQPTGHPTLRLTNATAQLSAAVTNEAAGKLILPVSAATNVYRLDASQSKFIAHAYAGGLLWFKGHDHLIAIKDFSGEAQLTPVSITPASLQIVAKAGSMVETNSVFTEPQKQIINQELREIVLQPDQYPDIVFRSTQVTGKTTRDNQYDLRIKGSHTARSNPADHDSN
jgi:polyisoprenoid-binding protein YceI